ncbi:MAG: PAS domain-containing protein [Rhodothalassiaceae bacterium]
MTSPVAVKEIFYAHDIENVMQLDLYKLWRRARPDGAAIPRRCDLPRDQLQRHRGHLMISELDRANERIVQRFAADRFRALQAHLAPGHDVMLGWQSQARHREILMVVDLFKRPILLSYHVDDVAAERRRAILALLLPLAEDGETPQMVLHHAVIADSLNSYGAVTANDSAG